MQQVKPYIFIIFSLIFAGFHQADAQNLPYLERKITIHAVNLPLAEVFKSISTQAGVVFSYTKLDDKQRLSKSYYRKPLRVVLNDLFTDIPCSYKAKDKYIILKCNDKPKLPQKAAAPPAVLAGYVYSIEDSSSVENVSIYMKQSRKSAVSNKYGYFNLSYTVTEPNISLSFAKENYYDTSLIIVNANKKELIVYLYPNKQVQLKSDTIPDKVETNDSLFITAPKDTAKLPRLKDKFRLFASLVKNNVNFRNIKDTLFSIASFSVIPRVSTNRLLSVNTVNDFSFNLFYGISKGINFGEISSILNIDNGNVKYAQLAGIGNIVEGNFKGFQAAGLFNVNNKNTDGAQTAGLYNQTNTMKGIQLGGLVNIVRQDFEGLQLAGIANTAASAKGLQLSGIYNYAANAEGCQIAGILNKAKTLNGFQLALVNIADSCNGLPFGFISIVKHGYHKVELSQDELMFTYLAVRTGIDAVHNIFFVAKPLFKKSNIWAYGYGLGTSLKMKRRLYFDCDLTTQQMLSGAKTDIHLNSLSKLFAGIEYRMFSKFSLALGPTYNIIVADVRGTDYLSVDDEIKVHQFFTKITNNVDIRMWIGGKLSLKFF